MKLKVRAIRVINNMPRADFTVYSDGSIGSNGGYPKRGDCFVSLAGEDTPRRQESLEILLSHLKDFYEDCAPSVFHEKQ